MLWSEPFLPWFNNSPSPMGTTCYRYWGRIRTTNNATKLDVITISTLRITQYSGSIFGMINQINGWGDQTHLYHRNRFGHIKSFSNKNVGSLPINQKRG